MIHSNPIIEQILARYSHQIGKDFDLYRNHVYRVFNYSAQFAHESMDSDKFAIAAAFHDLGIWTDGTFDYLRPSVREVAGYLIKNSKEEWTDEVASIIGWHHKVTSYKGVYQRNVEIFRKTDWIDVSIVLSFGVDRKEISRTRKSFPFNGFHTFLIKMALLHFLRHPLNPLPMFRK